MNLFPFLIISINHFIFGMALQCYQCNSETHRRCHSEDLLLDKFLIECPPSKVNYSGLKTTPFCSKINQWIYFTKKKREAVIRGCNYFHKFKEKCETKSDRDSYLTICFCGTDGCNSGRKTGPTSKFIIIQIFLHYIIFISLFPT